MKTVLTELIQIIVEKRKESDISNTLLRFAQVEGEKLLKNEKSELSRAFEQGKQAQWESQNMKKGLQPHNISFEEYYSTRYN